MSWMITWEGNSYYFGDNGESVIGYHRHAGTVIALADPVCPSERLNETVSEFTTKVESTGLTPCLLSVTQRTADAARGLGWRTIQIAEDTLVDLPGLEFKGKSWQSIRTAINRAKKEGIEFRLVTRADEPFSVLAQVRAISEEWVGNKGLPEMGFTLGSVEEALDRDVRVGLAVDAQGSIHGVTSWLPVYGPGGDAHGWTLDVMRRRQDGFRPVMEFLIGSAALAFKDQHAQFISLSGAPLARSDEAAAGDAASIDRMLESLGAAMEPFYGFRSLHTFKRSSIRATSRCTCASARRPICRGSASRLPGRSCRRRARHSCCAGDESGVIGVPTRRRCRYPTPTPSHGRAATPL